MMTLLPYLVETGTPASSSSASAALDNLEDVEQHRQVLLKTTPTLVYVIVQNVDEMSSFGCKQAVLLQDSSRGRQGALNYYAKTCLSPPRVSHGSDVKSLPP